LITTGIVIGNKLPTLIASLILLVLIYQNGLAPIQSTIDQMWLRGYSI